jgi:hypothetical protein
LLLDLLEDRRTISLEVFEDDTAKNDVEEFTPLSKVEASLRELDS